MAGRIYSDAEKLMTLESIIENYRGTDAADVLKTICTDIRTRMDANPSKALVALSFQVQSASKCKARNGFVEIGHQQAIATDVLAHWPVIRHALESLKEESAP